MNLADDLAIAALDNGNYMDSVVGFTLPYRRNKEGILESMKPINYRILGLCGELPIIYYNDIIDDSNIDELKKYIDKNTADHILSIYPSSLPYVDANINKAPYVIAKILEMVNDGEEEGDIWDKISDVKIPFGTDQEYLIYKYIFDDMKDTISDDGEKLLRVIWGDDISNSEGSIIDNKSWIGVRLRFTMFLGMLPVRPNKNVWESAGINADINIIKDIFNLNEDSKYLELVEYLGKGTFANIYNYIKKSKANGKYNTQYDMDASALLYAITHNYMDFEEIFILNDLYNNGKTDLIKYNMANTMFYLINALDTSYRNCDPKFITDYVKKSKHSKYSKRRYDKGKSSKKYIWKIDKNDYIYSAIDYNIGLWDKLLLEVVRNSNPSVCGNMAYNYRSLLNNNPAKVMQSLYASLMSVINIEIAEKVFESPYNKDKDLSDKILSLYKHAYPKYKRYRKDMLRT
jgi:hypothetical protein